MTSNEDFLFAQQAVELGFVTDAHVKEALELQKKMAEDLRLDERLAVLLVKRGYLAEDQARRVYSKIQPDKGGPGEIHGYRLLEVVGRGAMGTVYRAQHLGLNRQVAIKILRPDLAGDRTQIERLKAEAAMLASLDHPNIVRALDAGESNGFPYVVMEYVEGESLRDRLRREGPLPEADALRIARSLADALERARRMGVVHRDVKPGNVLLTKAGAPKLMDLGLAKGPIDLGLTQHGATVGTPQYIAPEQALDPKKADTRSDIYSLGATLYAMLTGEPPFDGKTLAEILTKVLYEVPVPVRSRRPSVSAEAGYLVERMMLRDPSLRYRTPALVVGDIDRLTAGTSIVPKGFSGNWEAFLLRKRVRKTTVVVGVLAAVLLVGGFGWKWVHGLISSRNERDRVTALAVDARQDTAGRIIDSRFALDRRISMLSELAEAIKRTDAPGADWVEAELRELLAERDRVAGYDRLKAERVDPARADGDFATATRMLEEFIAKAPGGLARILATREHGAAQRESDEALSKARRQDAFPAEPRDVFDIAESARRWVGRVSSRFARTDALVAELAHAGAAQRSADLIAASVRRGLESLAHDDLVKAVEAQEFAEWKDKIARLRVAAEAVRGDEGGALSSTEPRYVVASTLTALVAQPFEERATELQRLVSAAAQSAMAKADALAEADPDRAIALLDAFVAAASRQEAFPSVAQDVRKSRDDVERRSRERLDVAHEALAALVADVVTALRAHDLVAVDERIGRTKSQEELFRPVARQLDELARIVPALRRLEERAFAALAAHWGPDPKLQLPSLQLRGERLQKVEILRSDSSEHTFDLQTHLGAGTQPHPRIRLSDIADEEQFRLAGVDRETDEGAWLFGILAIQSLPVRDEDFYVAIDALAETLRRFSVAKAEASPLAQWSDAERRRLAEEAAEYEERATTHLKSIKDAFARDPKKEIGAIDRHIRALTIRDVEPWLVYTKVARESQAYLAARTIELKQLGTVDALQRLWPGAQIDRRQGSGAGDLRIVATFDFDGDTPPGDSFLAGWARVEPMPVGPGRPVTPGPGPSKSLRLHPFPPGAAPELVADRPLGLASVFDVRAARSMSFNYWPGTPFVLVLDLDGVQVAILSDDPMNHPVSVLTLPLLPGETPPRKAFDVYGTGRGVKFHSGGEIGDPARWPWDDAHQGRHFVSPSELTKSKLESRFFAFQSQQDKPYAVRFTWEPENGARLEVDGRLVLDDRSLALPGFAPVPSGKIQILTYTSCVIDDLRVSGRVSAEWIKSHSTPPTPASGVPGK